MDSACQCIEEDLMQITYKLKSVCCQVNKLLGRNSHSKGVSKQTEVLKDLGGSEVVRSG